jgi:cytochrome c-type biogenesis protein CcmH
MNGRAGWLAVRVVLAMTLAPTAAVAAAGESDAAARLRQLDESFRCVVCQNQSLADSNAELAADLRAQIRQQVRNGATDEQIRAYMVRRYGDFVLYRPPMKPVTWALWFGPFVLLVAGAVALWRSIARRREFNASELDTADEARADAVCDRAEEGTAR